MAPPIKQLQADRVVVKELQRRSRSATIAVRDRGRADIILLRLDGLGVEVIARRLNTTPKRVLAECPALPATVSSGTFPPMS